MPTYEYRCSDCGNRFEVFQRIDDDPLTVCEKCGGKLRKVFHPAGIVFKGSGFYATDSRSKSKSASKDSGSTGDKTSDKTREKASDKDTGGGKSEKKESSKSTEKTDSTSSSSGSESGS